MGPISSSLTIGVQGVLTNLGLEMSFIGAINSPVVLGNSPLCPHYRIQQLRSSVYMEESQHFVRKRHFRERLLPKRQAKAAHFGIEITNLEDLREIDNYVSNETIGNYKKHLQDIIDIKVRPLLFGVLPAPGYILQELYDLGARAGDVIYFGELTSDLLAILPIQNASIVLEMALGGIHVTSAAYIGTVGKTAAQSFQRKFGFYPSANSCFHYDSVYALAHTLKFLIHQGKDYEDPRTFMQTLRSTQFRGCSGLVAFGPSSNDRSFSGYVVMNLQGSITAPRLVQARSYTPTAVKVLDFQQGAVWPGGGTLFPLISWNPHSIVPLKTETCTPFYLENFSQFSYA